MFVVGVVDGFILGWGILNVDVSLGIRDYGYRQGV